MNTHDKDYVRAAIEANRKQRFEKGDALKRYKECGANEEQDPIERLRFFCSLAMSGQDWLDSEQFFDDLIADRQRRGPLTDEKIRIIWKETRARMGDGGDPVLWFARAIERAHGISAPQPTETVKHVQRQRR